jgi:signal transduction histidine kinase
MRGLSALSAHSYASAEEAAAAILQLITDLLGMRTSYFTRLLPTEGQLEILAAYSTPGGCAITAGDIYSVPETFSHEVLTATKPAPVVIESTHTAPCFQQHPAVIATPEIGSYVGVPMLGADAHVFGTLCAVDPEAHTLTPQQIDLLIVLARVLVTYIERDREIAERQQINAQLEQLSAGKSHFVSIISHEFRTALTGIQGFSEMMRDEQLSLEEMKEYATDINKEAKRLNRMITEMLDLDRMESGHMNLNLQLVDLNRLITNVVSNIQCNAAQHQIILQLEPRLPSLTADCDKLIQVVTNLLSNAIKYAPKGGEIMVTTEQNDDSVHIRVRDQGIGIAPEEIDSVFERFRRAQSDATRYIPGTGLGLPIVRQIIEIHGGRVWVESVLGEGSTFHVTLPVKPLV